MYTDELLQEIESFSYCYMTRGEISIITGAMMGDLLDEEHKAYTSFMRGRLRRKAEYNGSVIQLSKQLSSPAMAIEQDIARQSLLNDLKKL